MTTPITSKGYSFARMMVLSQRRHEERMVRTQEPAQKPEPTQRELALRCTLQKMNGTKRLLVFM